MDWSLTQEIKIIHQREVNSTSQIGPSRPRQMKKRVYLAEVKGVAENMRELTDSTGRTKRHNQFCEGHVSCPKTGKEECGKVMVTKVFMMKDGTTVDSAASVMCFGCGEIHNVEET